MNSVEVIELRAHRKLTVLEKIQVILLVLLVLMGIGCFFIEEMIIGVYAVLSPLLFIMGWTNYKLRDRKLFSMLYFLFGIVTIASLVLELI